MLIQKFSVAAGIRVKSQLDLKNKARIRAKLTQQKSAEAGIVHLSKTIKKRKFDKTQLRLPSFISQKMQNNREKESVSENPKI